jgi:hypothetical protein
MTLELWQIIVAVLTVGGVAVAIVRFWLNSAERAETALQEAKDVRLLAQSAHDKIGALTSAIAAYREIQAEKLVSREVLREVEERLAAAIDKLGDRFDDILQKLVNR